MSTMTKGPRLETLDYIRSRLLAEPEVAAWPEFAALVERPVKPTAKPSWEYALHACASVGGSAVAAHPACAAIFCMLFSIHLVDDLLDEDPDGMQHSLGIGTVANLGVAFQGLAGRMIQDSDLGDSRRARAQESIASMALETAYGQNLDASDLEGEEGYWEVLRNKTPPLFRCSLELGALYGGATPELASAVGSLGNPIGTLVQVNDDLKDALERPARPDWQRRFTNLPILFARTADHPDRDRFVELADGIAEGEERDLEEAQAILVRSGAVSYCAYQVIEAHRQGMVTIRESDLPDPQPLVELLEVHVRPLRQLLQSVGVPDVDRIFAS